MSMSVYEVELESTWRVDVEAQSFDDAEAIALKGGGVAPEEISKGVTGVWSKHSHD